MSNWHEDALDSHLEMQYEERFHYDDPSDFEDDFDDPDWGDDDE